MALTAAEEKWAKDQKKISDLQKGIDVLNSTAQTALDLKNTEITGIQNQLTTDVKVKQDAIDVLNA